MAETNKLIVNVDGMSCEHCKEHVTKSLEELAFVEKADVSLEDNNATVDYFGTADEDAIKNAIIDAGYEYKGVEYK